MNTPQRPGAGRDRHERDLPALSALVDAATPRGSVPRPASPEASPPPAAAATAADPADLGNPAGLPAAEPASNAPSPAARDTAAVTGTSGPAAVSAAAPASAALRDDAAEPAGVADHLSPATATSVAVSPRVSTATDDGAPPPPPPPSLAAAAEVTPADVAPIPLAWGHERVDTRVEGPQQSPDVAVLNDGSYVVVWQSYGQDAADQWGIFGQRFSASGQALGIEFRVNTETAGQQEAPRVAALSNGGFVVVWQDAAGTDGSGWGVLARRYDAAGQPVGATITVNAPTVGTQYQPSVAAYNGGWAVVYVADGNSPGSSSNDVYLKRFDNAGNVVTTDVRVSTTPGNPAGAQGGNQQQPDLAAYANGNLVLVWEDSGGNDGSGYGVYARRWIASSQTFTDSVLVNTTTSGNQYEPQVAVLADGGFVVVWRSDGQDGSSAGVYAQRFTAAGAKAGSEFRVNESTTGGQYQPAVAALAGGGFVVGWYNDNYDLSGSGSYSDVYVREYDAAGAPLSGQRKLVTPGNGSDGQSQPAVAAFGGGGFAVVYTAYDSAAAGGNNTNGIFQQLFGDAPALARQASPTVGDFGGSVTFAENLVNASPQVLDIVVSLADADSANFAGGRLDLGAIEGGSPNDQFGVRDEGSGAGQIGVVGNSVRYGGVAIGTLAGGADGTNLVITFNAAASVAAVEALLQNLTYANTSSSPLAARTLALRVSDGDGGTSQASRITVNVTPELDGLPVAWGHERVDAWRSETQQMPDVAVLNDGSYVIVWQSYAQDDAAPSWGLYGQRFSAAGEPLGVEFRINTLTAGNQDNAHVTALSNGGFVVVWQDANGSDGSAYGVYARRYDAAGQPQGADVVVNTTTAGNQYHGSVAAYNGGWAVAYYSDANAPGGDSGDIYIKRYDNAGNVVTDQLRVSTTPGNPADAQNGNQQQPDIAAAANGNLVIVWEDQSANDGSGSGVYGRRWIASTQTFSDTFLVNTVTASNQSEPQVALLADGGFVVVWRSDGQDGSGASVHAQRYTAGGVKAGSEFRVNESTTGNQYQPAVTAVAGGGFVVAWYNDYYGLSGSGSYADVYVREYDAAGRPVDGERALVTDGNPGDGQSMPAIAHLGQGSFVVAYTGTDSAAAGGNGTPGIFQQLFGSSAALARQSSPVLGDVATSVRFTENLVNATPQLLDAAISLSDADSADFAGGRLDLFHVEGADAGDQLGVRHVGNGAGQVGVSGASVRFGGVTVGTLTGGSNGSDLSIVFNANATLEAVEAVVQSLTFGSSSQSPDAGRTLALRLSDGDGGVSDTSTIRIEVAREVDGTPLAYGQEPVNAYTPLAQENPDVAVLADGSYVVVWQSYSQDAALSFGVYGQRFTASGVPIGQEFRINTAVLGDQSDPRVTALSNGGFVVTWLDEGAADGSGSAVYAQRYNAAGTAQGGNLLVNTATTSNQFHGVSAGYNGGWASVYFSSGAPGHNGGDIYLKRYDNSGAVVTDETRVSTTPGNPAAGQSGAQDLPDVAAYANGNLVIVWRDQGGSDGNVWGIFGRRYNAGTGTFSDTFLVNTTTTGYQYEPQVATLADGGFVVVWRSDGQDGSGAGVYVQRFSAAGVKAGAELRVNETTSGGQYQPAVTGLSTGGFVVAWYNDNYDLEGNGTYADVYIREYDSAGSPVDGQRKLQAPGNVYDRQAEPAIADLGNGNFIVTYTGLNSAAAGGNDTNEIFQQIFGSSAELPRTSAAPVLGDVATLVVLSAVPGSPTSAATPQVLDADVAFADADSADFAGGQLTVTAYGGGSASESLGIRNQGNGTHQVGVSGGNVSYQGVLIGTVTGAGPGSGAMVVTFNASADAEAVRAVLQNLTYQHTAPPAGTTDRFLGLRITDGDGGVSQARIVQVRIQPTSTPPVIALDDVSTSVTVTESQAQAGVLLDDAVQVGYDGTTGFANGKLLVSYLNGSARSADQLALRSTGNGPDEVSVAAGVVRFQGTAIGSISAVLDGADGRSLEVTFNAAASRDAVEAVIESLAYRNTSDGPMPARTLRLQLSDGAGVSAPARDLQVLVTAQPDPAAALPAGVERQVNTYEPGAQTSPAVARLSGSNDGGYVVVWVSQGGQDGESDGVFAQRYDARGAAIGAEFQVNSQSLSAQTEGAVAGLANGGFVVVWRSQAGDGSGWSIQAQQYAADGSAAGAEFRVNTTTLGLQYEPAVIGLADGSYVVAWRSDYTGTQFTADVLAQRYGANGAPIGPEFTLNPIVTGTQYEVRLAALAAGGYVAVWTDTSSDGNGTGIVAQRFAANGTRVGTAFTVNTDVAGNQTGADVAALGGGGFVVVWHDGTNVLAQRYTAAGAAAGGTITVTTADAPNNYNTFARVSALGNGGFVVTWDGFPSADLGGSSLDVMAQQFDALGNAVDGPVIVNSVRTSTQYLPAVTGLGGTGAHHVVVWAGYGQEPGDRGNYGVFQRLYGDAALYNASAAPVLVDLAPVVSLPEALVNAGPQLLDTGVSLSDADSADFAGGRLTVSVVQGYGSVLDAQLPVLPAAQDAFGIRNQGTGAGQVGVSGSTVTFGGVAIGTIVSDGLAGRDLVVQFNAAATAQVVEAVIENLTYANSSPAPVTTRTVAVVVTDGDGGSSAPRTITLNVVPPDADGPQPVGTQETVNTMRAGTQGEPQVARLADGGWVVVWTDDSGLDGSAAGIVGQRYDASGVPRGLSFVVNATNLGPQDDPSIASLSSGGWVVMWRTLGQDGSGYGIHGQRYGADGLPAGGEFLVNTTTANEQRDVDVVGLAGGGFVATWYSQFQNGNFYDVYAQRFSADGVKLGGEVKVNTSTGFLDTTQAEPAIAAFANGGYVIVWRSDSQDGSGAGVYAQRFAANGNPAGAELRVNTTTVDTQSEPDVAVLADGSFVAVWRSEGQDGNGAGVFAQRFSATGARVGNEFRVNPDPLGNAYQPTVAALDGGGFVVAWNDDGQAWVQAYDASGMPAESARRLDVADASANASTPAITGVNGGGWVVAWRDYDLGNASYDVAQQLFAPAGAVVRQADPLLVDVAATVTFAENALNAAPRLLDPGVGVADPDSANFAGGTLEVAYLSAYGSNDRFDADTLARQDQLGLRAEGNGPGQVAVAGSTVSVGGVAIGSIESAGTDGARFVVRFNANATAEAVERVIENLTYANTASAPEASRTIGIRLTDGDGGASEVRTMRIDVTPSVDATQPMGVERIANSTVANQQTSPSIAQLGGGGHVVVWRDTSGADGAQGGIFGQRYDAADQRVGGEFRINTTTAGDQSEPQVAALAGGGFVVVWRSDGQDGSGAGVYAQRYNAAGVAQGAELRVNTITASNQYQPVVAGSDTGGFVVAWYHDGLSSGNTEVRDVFFQRFNAAGVAQGVESRANPAGLGTSSTQSQPAIAWLADNSGFVVVWTDSSAADGSGNGVFGQRFNANGVAQGATFQANTTAVGSQADASIAALKGGGWVVSWVDDARDGSGQGIYAQRFNAAGAKLGGEFRVNTVVSSTQTDPTVAALDNGGWVIAWSDASGSDGSGWGVKAQHFDANGVPMDGEVQVNRYAYSTQDQPALAATPDGGFLAAYAGYVASGDGNGDGLPDGGNDSFEVRVQRFGTTPPAAGPTAATGAEDTTFAIGLAAFEAGYTDVDGQLLQGVRITALPSRGNLRLDGSPVAVGQVVTRTQLQAGELTYRGNLDVFGADSLGFAVFDGITWSAASSVLNLTISNVNDGPRLEAGADDTATEGAAYSHSITLGDPDPEGHRLTIDWGDGNIETLDVPNALTHVLGHTYADSGSYRVSVTADDRRGLANSIETDGWTVAVGNVAPTAPLTGAARAAEGRSYTLGVGAVVDPGQDSIASYTIAWGDGTSSTYTAAQWAAAGGSFSHVYADGAAGGTARTITVNGTDEDGSYTLGTRTINVDDVAPTANVTGANNANEGRTYTLRVSSVTEPGQDTRTGYAIDWGDGTGSTYTAAQWATAAGVFTHTYADGAPGTGTPAVVTVRTTDEDGTHVLGIKNVNLRNLAPSAPVNGADTADEGRNYVLRIGVVNEPGTDTRTSYTIAWGDGQSETFTPDQWAAAAGRFTHVYRDGAAAGTPREISVRTVDEDGTFTLGTKSIVVNNVAPTAPLAGNASVAQGAVYTLTVGAIADPGADTRSAYRIDWGDGTSSSFTPFQWNAAAGSFTHSYGNGNAGLARTITVQATDEDGTFTLGTRAVNVTAPAAPGALAQGAEALGGFLVDEGELLLVDGGMLHRLDAAGDTVDAAPLAAPAPADAAPMPMAHTSDAEATALEAGDPVGFLTDSVEFHFDAIGVPKSTDHLLP